MAWPAGEPMTMPRALLTAAARTPTTAALVDVNGTTTDYAGYLRAARHRAAALVAAGVESGDRVAIWAPNSPAWAVTNAAVHLAGAAVVPVNTRYTVHEAVEIVVERASCRAVVASSGFLGRDLLGELRVATSVIGDRQPVLVDIDRVDGPAAADALAEIDRRAAAVGPDDIAHVQFTSGTTGRPKGALLRHGPSIASSLQWIEHTGLGAGDRYPIVAPFSHLGGHKTGLLNAVLTGATALPEPVVDVPALVERIRTEALTFMQAAPTVFLAVVEAARRDPAAVSSVRVAVTGAAVVPPSLVRELRELVGCQVFTSYGLTEATGAVTITRADDSADAVATTCGRPLAGVDVEVVDAGDLPVPTGGRGEVRVRGASVMAGYLGDPSATAEVLRDGWLYTGDVGELDGGGRLRIVGRLKDLIVVGGLNVSPAEVEHALLEHPACAAAAVIGAPHERLGEVPVAFVVLRDDVTAEELTAFCRARLAGFKTPRRFVTVDTIPTNAAGKVVKAELRAVLPTA